MEYVETKTLRQIKKRIQYVQNGDLKVPSEIEEKLKAAYICQWKEDEIERLKEALEIYKREDGSAPWSKVAVLVGTRSSQAGLITMNMN